MSAVYDDLMAYIPQYFDSVNPYSKCCKIKKKQCKQCSLGENKTNQTRVQKNMDKPNLYFKF